jgi:ribonucleoside-diphosphate reductase alpha chain
MKFEKYFHTQDNDVYDSVEWTTRDAKITDAEGNVKFEMKGAEVPADWSQLAADIFASKYCRKSGVPNERGHEWSLKQVVDRIAGTITDFGYKNKYFNSQDDAKNYYNDLKWILINQYGAFNSPVWFNVGLWHKYKIEGTGQNWARDFRKKIYMSPMDNPKNWDDVPDDYDDYYQPSNQYERPQASACFIQSIEDDLGSIFDLAKNESSIFKYGSGSGVNVSSLRGKNETLSGGGQSSGVISFLKMLDSAAGVIKSGGVQRRSAALRALDADHPEILDFINWKIKEEEKAEALIAQGYDSDFNGEAYATVSGQNSNNAVRLTDEFMEAVENGGDWRTTNRTNGEVYETHKARDIFQAICNAAWKVADPGIQFDTTINNWHTCKESGRQESTNPCSEFSFLNDSACNLASLNLAKFWKDGKFDIESFRRAVRIFITAQDILVDLGSYPTKEIAKNSHEFRPLGLGYSNLGTLLMLAGYPYDSDEGRTLAALVTSVMTGTAYETSAELAKKLGAFEKFEENKKTVSEVIDMHSNELSLLLACHSYDVYNYLSKIATKLWKQVNEYTVFRNAQCTLAAPCGTIGLLMDCDTTGIEPAFSLIQYKKLAGGGNLKMVNQSVSEILRQLGYDEIDVKAIEEYVFQYESIEKCQWLKPEHLPIFDCAMPSGSGKRFISWEGHIKMLAAVQPFLSGAISKTVNVSHNATVQDIWDIFMKSWKLGLKAITVYRDGSKSSQPLNVEKKEDKNFSDPDFQAALKKGIELKDGTIKEKPMLKWGESKKLPAECVGRRWRFEVGGTKLYLRSGEYEDGTLGEIWIDLEYKEGSTVRSLMNQFAISISYALQAGVSLDTLVKKFSYTRFEPHGFVRGNKVLKTATSLVDAVFRILSYHYLGDTQQFVPDAPQNDEIKYQSVMESRESGNHPPCSDCGGIDFLRTGTCFVCVTCGCSQGCS